MIKHLPVKIDKNSENRIKFGICPSDQCKASKMKWQHDAVATIPLCHMFCRSLWRPSSGPQVKAFQYVFYCCCFFEWSVSYVPDIVLSSRALKRNVMHSCCWEISLLTKTTNKNKDNEQPRQGNTDTGLRNHGERKDCLGHLGSPWGNHMKNMKF